MSQVVHSVEVLDTSSLSNQDRLVLGNFPDIPTVAGSGAGTAVVKTFTFAKPISSKYSVFVQSNQDATAKVTAKTSAGFTVTLYPRLAASTLAVGTIDIGVLG